MYINSKKRFSLRIITAAFLAISALIITVVSVTEKADPSKLKVSKNDDIIRVLDVGQGDSILVSSNGKHLLIDTGTSLGADSLCSKLRGYGVKTIDVLLLTHFHNDHAGGIETVTDRFNVESLIYPDSAKSDQMDAAALNAKNNVLASEGEFYVATKGMSIELGDFEITVLGYYPDLTEENNRSIVVMIKLGYSKFLMMADAEEEAENALLEENIDLRCDVIKIAHHGSSSSSGEDFLKVAKPKTAVISCGAGNVFSHPHEDTIKTLYEMEISVFRTDLNGDITFLVTGNDIEVECERPLE